MADIYEELRTRLDSMATGFPASGSGVELRILRRLFSQEEAKLFLRLSPRPERPPEVAKRVGVTVEEAEERLESMAKKGLLFRIRKGDEPSYAAAPYIVGIFEHQVNHMDRDVARDMDEYFESALGRTIQSFKTPVMRSIPINRKIVVKWPVAPYEDALAIIDAQDTIAVAPCICRTSMGYAEKGCGKPVEACFMFGSHARYYVENGMGRYINREEAREILQRNDEAGLVIQPFNSQKVGGMCSCCGDCCGMLRSLKKQPNPAAAVQSNYFARVASDECAGCETCLERCQMEAIAMTEEKAVINLDRCIGCGLCVTTCSTGALELVRKPEGQLYEPPRTGVETYAMIAAERGSA
jgi:Na+-translocating ferredoxin:NAD+ oxidoreductase subunit B